MKSINRLILLLIILVLGGGIFIFWKGSSPKKKMPCPFWLKYFVEIDNPWTKYNRAEMIIVQANLKPGMHVIDYGCGPGRLTLPLARAVGKEGQVIAVDRQGKMLESLAKKAQKNKLKNIQYIRASIDERQLPVKAVDHAFLVNVLGEIEGQTQALNHIYQVLKPGGFLTITETRFDPHFQNKIKVIGFIQNAGFEICDLRGHWATYSLLLKKPYQIE